MKAKHIFGFIFTLFGIFMPVSIVSAEEAPVTFPETIQSLTPEEIDALQEQVMAVGSPLAFDEEINQWSFVGIPDAMVRYDMRTIAVDLVRVRFPDSDGPRIVWVVAGLQGWGPDVDYLGSWPTAEAAYNTIQLGETVLEVHIDGNFEWSSNQAEYLTNSGFEISNKFISSGGAAPSWYAWGSIFWEIDLQIDNFSPPLPSDHFETLVHAAPPGESTSIECREAAKSRVY